MNMNRVRIGMRAVALLGLSSAFVGCGSAEGGVEPSDAAQEESVQDAVAQVDVGYGTVYFLESYNADGTVATGIGERVPADYPTTPLQQMMAEGHTNLEVFLTLLPNAEPPASFVDAHRVQVGQLGRETDEVRLGQFDANAPIQKSTSWCRGIAMPAEEGEWAYTYSGTLTMDEVYGSQSLTLNAGKKAVAPAICNENLSSKSSSHKVQGRVRMKKNGGSYDSPGWTPLLSKGQAWYWLGLQLTETVCDELCLPVAVDATYKLEGKTATTSTSNTYDLVIAKIESVTYTGIIR